MQCGRACLPPDLVRGEAGEGKGQGSGHHLGVEPNKPKKLSKRPGRGGASAMTLAGGRGPPRNGRTGVPRVAASMKRRHVCAGSELPVTLFIGELSSLPSQTPA